ncbi:hypothetical protein [Acidimangrovimonas sediminis]|uniref:hypothetical protein n=1 Tax=Acidimangrovimonas sediminis TaxID=2056283 RepID=UPI000C7FF60D|nr:hypothetical protein [Acidimangrovimonas sediminis]
MDTDLIFVIGLLVGALAIPAILSAFVDGRPPRAAAIMLLVAGVLVVVAVTRKPGGYTFEGIPNVVYRVIGQLTHGS